MVLKEFLLFVLFSSLCLAENKPFEHDLLLKNLMTAKSQEGIEKILGKPAAVESQAGMQILLYEVAVQESGKAFKPAVHLMDGRFQMLNLVSPEAMAERIKVAKLGQSAAKSGKKNFTPQELEALVKFKEPKEVVAALGEPAKKQQLNGKEVWTYENLVLVDGKPIAQHLQFDYGRVNYLWTDALKK